MEARVEGDRRREHGDSIAEEVVAVTAIVAHDVPRSLLGEAAGHSDGS